MDTTAMSLAVSLGAVSVQASPVVRTLDTNMTSYEVNAATNVELAIPSNPFQSDSLARSGSGTLYSPDSSV